MRTVLADAPALIDVQAHALAALSVAPELALRAPLAVARSFAFSREGNPPAYTRRVAHGVTELWLTSPRALTITNLAHADPTDRELVDVLRRRAPSGVEISADDEGPPPPMRDETPTSLLAEATARMHLAYYDGALEAAVRGRVLATGKEHSELTRHMLFALVLLRRLEDVDVLCTEIRATSADDALLAHAAYAMAMLHARIRGRAERDYDEAAHWVAVARRHTEAVSRSTARAVNLAFLRNTEALVELRRGKAERALGLLDEALGDLARDAPDAFALECPILYQNRARLRLELGDVAAAIADYDRLLAHESSSSEGWFERAMVHHRRGDASAALADYDAAIAWSPPWPEPHVNRAQMLDRLGRRDEAFAAYDYALVLEPTIHEALVNRGCLHLERRDIPAALADFDRALALADDPKLRAIRERLARR